MKKQTKINKQKQKQINKQQFNQDQRFSSMKYDPKFITPNSKLTKIKIDDRFAKMITDKRFSIDSMYDKYGRKNQKQTVNSQLKDYYYIDEKEDQQEQIENNEQYSQEGQQQQSQQNQNNLRKWMEEYNEQSSEDLNEQIQEQQPIQYQLWSQQQGVIKNEKVLITNRLALCNYDWMNISSNDLMLLFNSFKPKDGIITSIDVYKSQYGKIKLEEQETKGPSIFLQSQNTTNKKIQSKAIDQQKLRAYQKDRLKYYFAIINCDKKTTAEEIYIKCDGEQFENSNLSIDLRYVPNDTKFDGLQIKQSCKILPTTGQVKQTVGKAIGHSKVSLTWQDPQLSLTASLKRKNWNKMNDSQFEMIDWGMYINEEQLEQNENIKKMQKVVKINKQEQNNQKQSVDHLTDWRKQCSKKRHKNPQNDDIQITFSTGFQSSKNKKDNSNSLNKQKKSLNEKRRQKQQKHRQQLELLVDKNNKGQDFKVNVNDNRFTQLYTNPLYSIDPVDAKFDHRKTGKIFQEIVKRNKNKQSSIRKTQKLSYI